MNDKRKLAKALGDDDVAYLADAYDLDKATVRGFNDDEWCQFFGCSSDELSYYLFDESSAVFADQELEMILTQTTLLLTKTVCST